MNTVSGSSTFSTSAASNRGMSGLVSGLDTEGMVESMLSGTQGKIDKANQEKQVITWKQEIYRDLISEINGFKSTFFGSTSSTNLTSTDFFNSMSAASASTAFGVTASPNASTGRTNVQVGQLATASKLSSQGTVSGKLAGKLDMTQLERRVVFKVGDDEIVLQLDSVPTEDADGNALSVEDRTKALAKQINDKLTAAGANDEVTAKVNDKGQLVLEGDVTVSAKSSALGLSMLGAVAGKKAVNGELATSPSLDAVITFDLDLNGITRTITLDNVNSGSTEDDLKAAIQEKIDEAFGSGWVKVDISGGAFELTTKGKGNVATIGGSSTGLKLLGVENGESNKIARGQQLGKMNFGTELLGTAYKFTINGVNFSFDSENTLNDVLKAVNGSKAGVRITYSEIEDKFTIESTNTGAGYNIKMTQESGNLLNALFGDVETMTTGGEIYSSALVKDHLDADSDLAAATEDVDGFEYGYFKFNVNGTGYSIAIPKRSDEQGGVYRKEEVFQLINEGLASRFGYMDQDGTPNDVSDDIQAIELVKNADGSYKLEVRNGAKVTFTDESVYKDDGSLDATETAKKAKTSIQMAFGFGGENLTNAITGNTAPDDVTIGEVGLGELATELGLTSASKLSDVADAIKSTLEGMTANSGKTVTVRFEGGKFVVAGDGTLEFPPKLAALFNLGDGAGTANVQVELNQAAGAGAATIQDGQNALVTINGVDLERSSNTFTVNGLTFSLTDTTGDYENLEGFTKNADGTYSFMADGTQFNDVTADADGYLSANGVIVGDIMGNKIDADGNRVFNGENETVTVTRDTEKIFDGLKSFVDKYNELIKKLNDLVDEDATYKKYPPLTSAQKKEMSDKEIELWEEKAKEGLFRNDSNLESFLSSMRLILYTKPTDSDYALYDIGIETSSEWKDKGQLVLDESKLKTMIESNPAGIMELFTNAEEGLGKLLSAAVDRTASTNSGSPGTLVALAGVEGKASSITNTLTKRLRELNSKIKDLQKKYEKERDRYWKQFNAMETALSNLNTQSSWLAQQFA